MEDDVEQWLAREKAQSGSGTRESSPGAERVLARAVRSENGCLEWHGVFEEADCVVDADGSVTVRGDSPEHVRYRAETIARVKQERGY